jgi:hypothetical protein
VERGFISKIIMSIPIFRVRCFLVTLALTWMSVLLQPAFAAPSDTCGSVDRLIVALRVARILYPELKGKEFGISISHGTGTFASGATEADDLALRIDHENLWHPPDETAEEYYAQQIVSTQRHGIEFPLYLYFSFIDTHGPIKPRHLTCFPLQFRSDVNQGQMKKVQMALNSHPDWSDEEELKAAMQLGLRYGPGDKATILRLLPLDDLSKIYGPLQIKSVRFSLNVGRKCQACSFADPSWNIAVSEVGTSRSLFIVVEPFFGKITSISE